MPTYGYECIGCSNSFEIVQRITEDALTKCDSCGGALKKKVFPVGVVFKGSGFYVNDYAKKTGESAAKAEPAADAKAAEPAASPASAPSSESASAVKPAETAPSAAPAAPVVPSGSTT